MTAIKTYFRTDFSHRETVPASKVEETKAALVEKVLSDMAANDISKVLIPCRADAWDRGDGTYTVGAFAKAMVAPINAALMDRYRQLKA